MSYFSGKTAVVTGAGDGIGRALALQLNAEGCRLWLCDIKPELLAQTHSMLSRPEIDCHTAIVDCGNPDAIYRWAADVAEQTPSLDLLINNAGVAYGARFEESTDENFRWLMDINFWGVVTGTRAFLPLLRRSSAAHLVNLSSIFGMVSVPTQTAYNAAKFAVRGFTEALIAENLNSNLHITAVHPGGISTGIAYKARSDGQAGQTSAEERDAHFRRYALTTPEKAAAIILKAAKKKKRQVLVGMDAKLVHWLVRLLPTRYHWITARVAPEA